MQEEQEEVAQAGVLFCTWNVHSFMDCRRGEIAAEAAAAGVEVLLLQECTAAGLDAQFPPAEWTAVYCGAPGDWMGNAVCVRGRAKLLETRKVQLDGERSALWARIELPGRRPAHVFATHLDHQSEARRLWQVEALLREAERLAAACEEEQLMQQQQQQQLLLLPAFLLGGDLNSLCRADYEDARWAELQVWVAGRCLFSLLTFSDAGGPGGAVLGAVRVAGDGAAGAGGLARPARGAAGALLALRHPRGLSVGEGGLRAPRARLRHAAGAARSPPLRPSARRSPLGTVNGIFSLHQGVLSMSAMGSALLRLVTPKTRYRDRQFTGSDSEYAAALERSGTVYVGNLAFFTTEEQIYEVFSRAGEIKR